LYRIKKREKRKGERVLRVVEREERRRRAKVEFEFEFSRRFLGFSTIFEIFDFHTPDTEWYLPSNANFSFPRNHQKPPWYFRRRPSCVPPKKASNNRKSPIWGRLPLQ
jgi:hypothetical protein